jgi:hypothetical protein
MHDDQIQAAHAALDAAKQAIGAAQALLARRPPTPDGAALRLTIDDLVARKIAKSRRVARELVKDGKLPASRVGRELFFDPRDVEAFLASRAVRARTAAITPEDSRDDDEAQALARAGLRLVRK